MSDIVGNTIDCATFLDIVNAVLKKVEKQPLGSTSAQWSAIRVLDTDRVLQILAGPGSGKTEVLVWRVLYELFVLGAPASSLLVTTFTNRAARELEVRLVERADEVLAIAHKKGLTIYDPRIYEVHIGTIHSLCDKLLAEHDLSYVESGVVLADEAEILARLMRNYRRVLGFSTQPRHTRTVNRVLSVNHLVSLFRPPWKNDRMWPSRNIDRVNLLLQLIAQHTETWLPRCGAMNTPNGLEGVSGIDGLTNDLVTIQNRWEDYLRQENILDFATIQKRFTENQGLVVSLFRHVFVDEFQDSNPIQFLLHTNWLANQDCRLTVVGDDDQAVYRFRGSDLSCFSGVKTFCALKDIQYRQEKLETNYRSTKRIVDFCQAYKHQTVLAKLSMAKHIQSDAKALVGAPVRLLEGHWADICSVVAKELVTLGVGRVPSETGGDVPESVGILMFSTSERSGKGWQAPALMMRSTLENQQLRVYNPRCKTAADKDTPVGMLLGLISYLIDPISLAPVGKSGQNVMVWATHHEATYSAHALTAPPPFPINRSYSDFQKHFRKAGASSLTATPADRQVVLDYVDTVKSNLIQAWWQGKKVRLTLFGFVARLLAHDFFRKCGFTINMFRQALFTQLLESNIAPTRLTKNSLDYPLEVSEKHGKYVWSDRYWNLLNVLGSYIAETHLDDLEVESFEENAVPLITFHQAKGLEFDHVYVAGTGRNPDVSPVLRTALFSGEQIPFNVINGLPNMSHAVTLDLATADRDRENYVALTRAKKSLTLLLATDRQDDLFMQGHQAVGSLFANSTPSPHHLIPSVSVREWK